MIPFVDFREQYGDISWEDFSAQVKLPHLMLDLNSLQQGDGFQTERVELGRVQRAGQRVEMLIPVRKRRDSNAFAMMVTMGRAKNNDLVIPDRRVSSFHAYLRRAGNSWLLSDASSNGTHLDGQLLEPATEREIQGASEIRLAQTVELWFFFPRDLFERVNA